MAWLTGVGLEWSKSGVPAWVWGAAGFGLVVAVLMYGGFPLFIRRSLTLRGRPTVRVIGVAEMPAEVHRHFEQWAAGLQACGFTIKAYLHIQDMVPQVQKYVAFWTNESAGQMATAAMGYGRAGNAPVTMKRKLEFITKVGGRDGMAVTTNNASDLDSFRKVPTRDTLELVPTDDVQQLYRVHLLREARLLARADQPRFIPAEGEEARMFAEGTEFNLRRQVSVGYLVEDARTPALFRLTVRGAYMMTWAELPPMKGWLRRRALAKARRALEDATRQTVRPVQGVALTREFPYAR